MSAATTKKTATEVKKKAFAYETTIALKPRMSEKSYGQSHAENTFAFDVPLTANKIEVAKAVELQFNVTVKDVRILRAKGKVARSIRLGGARKVVLGKRPDTKKAYVRLNEGDTIPVFASIDEAAEKQEKLDAKLAKKEEKGRQKDSSSKSSKLPFRRKKKDEGDK